MSACVECKVDFIVTSDECFVINGDWECLSQSKAGYSNSAQICGSTVRRAEIQRNNVTTVELSFERGNQQQLVPDKLPYTRDITTRVHRCSHTSSYRCSDFNDERLLCFDPAVEQHEGRCYPTSGTGGCASCFGEERNGIENKDYQMCQDPDTANEGDSVNRCGDTCQMTEMETIVNMGQATQITVKQVQRGCANSMPEQTVREHVFVCEETQCPYNKALVGEVAGCKPETTTTIMTTTTPVSTTTTTTSPTTRPTTKPSTTTFKQTDNAETVIVALSVTIGFLFALILIIVVVMWVWCRNNGRKFTNSREMSTIRQTAQVARPKAIINRVRQVQTISIRNAPDGTVYSHV